MIDTADLHRDPEYYERWGPVPTGNLAPSDFFRYRVVQRYLVGNSVLDAGCARADFLRQIQGEHLIHGIEVTETRAQECNRILGQKVVVASNLETPLPFPDQSVDSVVCMQVLEHLIDPAKALREMIRVSRLRTIVTVPYDERIRYTVCVHCGKRTPYSGHLHSFNLDNVNDVAPAAVRIVRARLLCNKALLRANFAFRLPVPILSVLDQIMNGVIPKARWLLLVMDKPQNTAQVPT